MRLASQRITELAGHKKRVSSVTWSPGGLKLASAGVEQQVRLHDVEHGAGEQVDPRCRDTRARWSSCDSTRLVRGAIAWFR